MWRKYGRAQRFLASEHDNLERKKRRQLCGTLCFKMMVTSHQQLAKHVKPI